MNHPAFSQEEVTLVPGLGQWVLASSVHDPRVADNENSQEAVDALGIIPAGPNSDIPIVQHAMPCITPDYDPPTGPIVAQVPLKGVESPYEPTLKAKGWRSGARSSIMPASRTKGKVDWVVAYDLDGAPIYPNEENPEFYLRLKGCSMWKQADPVPFPGITLKPLPSFRHPPEIGDRTLEVRGTAFPKTATSEIINNPIINKTIEMFNLHSNNIPLGFWLYAPMDNDPAPNIPKVCNILKTNADRRLESNVFAGLEKIIYEKMNDNDVNDILNRANKVYMKHEIQPPSDTNRTYRRTASLMRYKINKYNRHMKGTTNHGPIKNLEREDLILKGLCPSEDIYEAIGDSFMIDGKPFIHMAKLFGRLGWEAGRCIAMVHRSGFDWGSYQDHTIDGMLDNAHANNICLLPKELMDLKNGRYQLLLPTDFDMSFRRDQAVNVWVVPPIPDPGFVDHIFSTEFGNMMGNLAGYTAALEGVMTAISKRDPDPSPKMDLVWLMRDICVWEYVYGYKIPSDPSYQFNDINLEQAYQFIPEAIMNTIDIIV